MSERCSDSNEQVPSAYTGTPLSEQELADTIGRELTMTRGSAHQAPVAETTQECPTLPESEVHSMPEYDRPGYRLELGGVPIQFDRVQETLDEKYTTLFNTMGVAWMPKRVKAAKLREKLSSGHEVQVKVTEYGVIRVFSGNTHLYAQLKLGFDPADIKVVYNISPVWHDTGPEYHHETLADLIEKVGKLERRAGDGV